MKYIITFLLLVANIAPAFAQKNALPQDAISSYFSEYVDDPRFNVIYVSGKVFQLFEDSNIDVEDMDDEEIEAILAMVQDIKGIRVLHTDENTRAFYKEAKQRISTDAYELLFKIRTKDGENVEAFIQDSNAVISEFFMLIGAEDNFAMLSFVGKIDLSKLSKLQDALND